MGWRLNDGAPENARHESGKNSRLTTKFRRVRPDGAYLRNNARPHVACNAWFGETMLRRPQSETAAVGADARVAENARDRGRAPRNHAAAACPRAAATVGAVVHAAYIAPVRCCTSTIARAEHLGTARSRCRRAPPRDSRRWCRCPHGR